MKKKTYSDEGSYLSFILPLYCSQIKYRLTKILYEKIYSDEDSNNNECICTSHTQTDRQIQIDRCKYNVNDLYALRMLSVHINYNSQHTVRQILQPDWSICDTGSVEVNRSDGVSMEIFYTFCSVYLAANQYIIQNYAVGCFMR